MSETKALTTDFAANVASNSRNFPSIWVRSASLLHSFGQGEPQIEVSFRSSLFQWNRWSLPTNLKNRPSAATFLSSDLFLTAPEPLDAPDGKKSFSDAFRTHVTSEIC